MLPSEPPKYASWSALVASIRQGETGWRVYALQSGLNKLGASLAEDGDFGKLTFNALTGFQQRQGLEPDGVAGPATQAKMIALFGTRVHALRSEVPDGLMRGFAEGEGANVLAATNWSVSGGVDCGTMQYRVYGPPFAMTAMKGAFAPLAAMVSAADEFLSRADFFHMQPWPTRATRLREQRAKRLAVLAHNWPAGARYYAEHGHAPSPDAKASWVPQGTRFPDGTPVVTRQEWCEFYAMGGLHGEGRITRYVTDWA